MQVDTHIEKCSDIIFIEHGKSKAEISLKNGASLTNLTLNKKVVVKDFSDQLKYQESFASAVLFPFANRILNGEYEFQNKKYQSTLNLNNKHAIHGFLYDKRFSLITKEENTENVVVTLRFCQEKREESFPFLFAVTLEYTLSSTDLSLKVNIKNTDVNSFPFTIGWHPYFFVEDRKNSVLQLETVKEVTHNEEMIMTGVNDCKLPENFQISDQKLDNCYLLEGNKVIYKTENYTIKLSSSHDENYIQIYTPPLKKYIAIEPVTGPSNSFNTKVGLKTLSPQDEFNIQWDIQLQDE